MGTMRRRLIVVVAVTAVIALGVVGVGVYGLVRGPAHPSPGASRRAPSATKTPGRPGKTGGPAGPGSMIAPATLPKTNDPVAYAKAVAAALFDWSTISGYAPADYTAPVLADADPSGEEIAGLIGDVTSYEPTTAQWQQLAGMDVIQHLQITGAVVPSLWPEALAESHGQLRPGTTAITITGVRHRSGVWYGEHATSATPVSFTVFLACKPAFSRCHTLRLSQLDNPLK